MEVLFEKIRGSCWVDRGSQHGFFNGRGGGLIENEKKERKREREKERKREREKELGLKTTPLFIISPDSKMKRKFFLQF